MIVQLVVDSRYPYGRDVVRHFTLDIFDCLFAGNDRSDMDMRRADAPDPEFWEVLRDSEA